MTARFSTGRDPPRETEHDPVHAGWPAFEEVTKRFGPGLRRRRNRARQRLSGDCGRVKIYGGISTPPGQTNLEWAPPYRPPEYKGTGDGRPPYRPPEYKGAGDGRLRVMHAFPSPPCTRGGWGGGGGAGYAYRTISAAQSLPRAVFGIPGQFRYRLVASRTTQRVTPCISERLLPKAWPVRFGDPARPSARTAGNVVARVGVVGGRRPFS